MKKLLLILIILLMASYTWAANTRTGNTGTPNNTLHFEQAIVDTDPGANGYATESVSLAQIPNSDQIEFYISAITGATVHLQWKRSTDASWTDYDSYTVVTRVAITSISKGIYWRGIVKDNNQGTTSTFGIDWGK